MKLTDSFIKAIKPMDKLKKYSDGAWLNLYCYPNGSKIWHAGYRYAGKPKLLSLGSYPEVSIKGAREKNAQIRKQLDEGLDPSRLRQETKRQLAIAAENSFKAVALKWHETWAVGKEPSNVTRVLKRLEKNVFKEIGSKPISSITAPMLVAMVKKIASGENTPLEIAKRSYATCSQIFRFAIAHGICERNPATDIKIADVIQNRPVVHRKRLDPKDLPQLLQKIETYDTQYGGGELTRLAMQLMTLTFLRTRELIEARWDEVDLRQKEWRVPAKRMKMKDPHIVHLSNQAMAIFKRLQEISGGRDLIFPSEKPLKSMSNNTILYALYRMGYRGRMTGHGFRGLASTTLHEQGYPHEHIELQLAHSERNSVSAAYNFAKHLPARAKMLQDWADYLDAIKAGAQVINIQSKSIAA